MDLSLVHPAKLPGSRDEEVQVQVFFELARDMLQVRFGVRGFLINENPGLGSGGWGLWDWDVVELFLAPRGSDLPYYEFQVSPLNQSFELEIHQPRKDFNQSFRSGFQHTAFKKSGSAWDASMFIPLEVLGWDGRVESLRGNAFAILGPPDARVYWSLFTGKQEAPDFHRPEDFRPLV